ncbi:MAG: Methyltransferase type 11 [Microgenomates bacterium 39_6]|nr:MAG: Methyltransferase type 11 [Microgenomates bacterium 39_6]
MAGEYLSVSDSDQYFLPDIPISKRPTIEVAHFWDRQACAWATGNLVEGRHANLIGRMVEELVSPLSDRAEILELASGANNLKYYPVHFDFSRVIAVDISSRMLKYLRFGNPAIQTINADARDLLPFQDESFDLALSFFSMRYLENQEAVIKELTRVVKPGGRVGIADYDDFLYGCEVRAFNARKQQQIIRQTGCLVEFSRLDSRFLPNLNSLVITKQS